MITGIPARVPKMAIVLATVVGLYMGLAAWGQGWCEHLHGEGLMIFNLPAFIAAGIVSGNIHSPHQGVFGILTFVQWAFLSYLFFSRVIKRPVG